MLRPSLSWSIEQYTAIFRPFLGKRRMTNTDLKVSHLISCPSEDTLIKYNIQKKMREVLK